MKYCLVTEETHLDARNYISYGISSPDGNIIHDISTDRNSMERLVSQMNEGQLAPEHFHDVVENFVAAI